MSRTPTCRSCPTKHTCKRICKKVSNQVRKVVHRRTRKEVPNDPYLMDNKQYYDDIHHKYKTRDYANRSVHFQDGTVYRGTFIKRTILKAYKLFYRG